jgi:hypothetical protein
MALEQQCPACGNAQGRAHRVSTVLGRKGIFLVDLTCESCAHEWSIELQALLARVEHLPPITDDSPRPE